MTGKYFGVPFAESGDKEAIPDASVNTLVSYETGYTPEYELDPYVDPNGNYVGRQRFNQLGNDITKAVKEIQEFGYKVYAADVNYPANARAPGSDGIIYRALIANGPLTTVVNPVGNLTGTWEPFGELSDLINGTSQFVGASELAAKTAYDKGVEGVNDAATAQSSANTALTGSDLTLQNPVRTTNTLYTNTTGRTIYVYWYGSNTSDLNRAYIDGSPVGGCDADGFTGVSVTLVVPNGSTYQIDFTTTGSWWEARP